MKKNFLMSGVLILAAFALPVEAEPLGAGLFLGEPSGLTAKYWLNPSDAVDGRLAYDFDNYFVVIADYQHAFLNVMPADIRAKNIFPYVGLGVYLGFGEVGGANSDPAVGVGIRVPLGLEWIFAQGRFGVALEVAPGLGIVPSTQAFVQGGLAFRYYF